MLNINKELFVQFKQFCLPYLECGDIDPVYPVLRYVHDARGMTQEQRIWHTLLYVTWYHLGTAERVWEQYPNPTLHMVLPDCYPTGTERRGHRGMIGMIKALELLNTMYQQHSPMGEWVNYWCNIGGVAGWTLMHEKFKNIRGNGPWAAYKWCDLCKNVLRYDITAPDIGVGGGSETAGPIPGMVKLTGEDWKYCALNPRVQKELLIYCLNEGINFDGLEEMETALCDFNSFLSRRYYVGHDIDKQQEDFTSAKVPEIYWLARQTVFPAAYLGELGGWSGVRNNLKGTLV